jgi:hypothetical protein
MRLGETLAEREMGIRLRFMLAARIVGPWLIGLALLWGLFLSGVGGSDTAYWMVRLLAAASAPVVLAAVIACLVLPRWVAARPVLELLCALALAAAAGAVFSGPIGLLYALWASVPGSVLYLLAVSFWPLRRRAGSAA